VLGDYGGQAGLGLGLGVGYYFFMDDVYRSAASVVVLRPTDVCSPDGCGTVYQILLLHKPRKKDEWQLPQGGVEAGESIEQAALRELMEEAGIADVRVIGTSPEKYKYDFPASFRRFRPDNVRGQCIEYVFALAPKETIVKVDGQEIDGHVWVLPEQLPLYIYREQYLECVEKLVQEAVAAAQKSK